ncbi:MAG: hypothetical protein PHO89_09245, partial [Methylacidiphilaceae bacterium]|nr:hypothetical protein [Candidatus Methylacidiphilaceae bacterium]
MTKMRIICLAVLWGVNASAAPPPIHPQLPADDPLPTPKKKVVETPSAAKGGEPHAPGSSMTAPVAPSEPEQSNPSNLGGEEMGSSDAAGGGDSPLPETGALGIVLDFRTRELMELKRIARELGGNLVISIEPRGITPADLIIPLKSSGLFEVSAKDSKTFLVTSSGEGQKRELEREIAALARRQAALLRNIEVLEAMRAEGRIPETKDGEGKSGKPSVAE